MMVPGTVCLLVALVQVVLVVLHEETLTCGTLTAVNILSKTFPLVNLVSLNLASQAYALSTQPPEDGTLQAWQWYPQSEEQNTGTYHALYPRSWFVYENVLQTQLTCEQFSPIWADNYQETSYPVAVFLLESTQPHKCTYYS